MKGGFIMDTGPLVAWLCPRDEHHQWARGAFAELPAGGIVCEACKHQPSRRMGRRPAHAVLYDLSKSARRMRPAQ